jgi:hypothetical protein
LDSGAVWINSQRQKYSRQEYKETNENTQLRESGSRSGFLFHGCSLGRADGRVIAVVAWSAVALAKANDFYDLFRDILREI